MHPLARLDHRYLWHPFTQMRDWLKSEPVTIVSGRGAVLRDVHGRAYLDANSSIWTNLHGHNQPEINAALRRQLKRIAHSSALGLANEPASRLAERLIAMANAKVEFHAPVSTIPNRQHTQMHTGVAQDIGQADCKSALVKIKEPGSQPSTALAKVFFSDDGSTAIEVALKLAYEFARRTGRSKKPRFLSLEGAYHGDTLGAVALGHIGQFSDAWSGLLFRTDKVMAPYCYRCRFNRAKPERADAREYRKCHWECLGVLECKFKTQKKRGNPYAGFVFEPLIQGAAGMIPQPSGWLRAAAQIARDHTALLIADEVMTGFGRTSSVSSASAAPPLFACHHESVQPDFLALAKGLTGGYLPMAATLTTQPVFDAFLGKYEEFKSFFHGHSFTGNQLGAAAALANLELLQSPASNRARQRLTRALGKELPTLWSLPNVGDIRQVGTIAGIELVKNWRTREPFDLRQRAGIRVCEALAKRGVLTRPIGNVIVLMPPYCTTPSQVQHIAAMLRQAIGTTFSS